MTRNSKRPPGLAVRLVQAASIPVFLLLSNAALAFECQKGNALTLQAPALPDVSPALPVGSKIGDWFQATEPELLRCFTAAIGENVKFTLFAAGVLATYGTANVDGNPYTIFRTGVDGLGIAFSWQVSTSVYSTCTSAVLPLPLAASGGECGAVVYDFWRTKKEKYAVTLRGVFVKTGDIVPGLAWGGTAEVARGKGAGLLGAGSVYQSVYINWPATTGVVNCSIRGPSSIDVPMGEHSVTEFNLAGVRIGERNFEIPLECPAGVNGVAFRVRPVYGAFGANTSGIAALESGGATGVGLRIAEQATDAPIPFDEDRNLSGFAPNVPGDYAIRLKAAYVATSGAVTPGAANSKLEVTVKYR